MEVVVVVMIYPGSDMFRADPFQNQASNLGRAIQEWETHSSVVEVVVMVVVKQGRDLFGAEVEEKPPILD